VYTYSLSFDEHASGRYRYGGAVRAHDADHAMTLAIARALDYWTDALSHRSVMVGVRVARVGYRPSDCREKVVVLRSQPLDKMST